MKYLLPFLLLGLASPCFAQAVPQPFKGATAIIVHVPDSASAAYKKVAQSLLSSGYMMDKSDKELGYVNTKPKAIGSAFALALQSAVASGSTGSDISFRGQFTWASAITIMAKTDKREIPVQCMGGGNTPVQQMWNEMLKAARLAYPSAQITYK